MRKFSSIFVLYSIILGSFVGIFTGAYMAAINFLIEFIWTDIPQIFQMNNNFYPLIIGIIGGVLIGLLQKKFHSYPKTMEEVLGEFKKTGRIEYKHEVSKTIITAVPALIFGGSIGPEASLTGIVGGMVNWVGDHLKLTLNNRKELTEMGIGAIFSTVFLAPFAGIGNAFDESKGDFKTRTRKILVYSLTVIFGVLGLTAVNKLFPHESTFGIHLSQHVNWTVQGILLIPIVLLLGIIFGKVFVWTGNLFNRFSANRPPIMMAIIGGVAIGIFGMLSPYMLFSGESSLMGFSKQALNNSFWILLLIAMGKTIIANLSFSTGWRGGLIFPAIFSSVAMGFAVVSIFPYTPGLLIAVLVAASITTVVEQPGVVAGLLLLLLPIQFFPFILLSAYLTKYLLNTIRKRHLTQN